MFIRGANLLAVQNLKVFGVVMFLVIGVGSMALGQSADEAMVRALAAKYFELYQQKDAAGVLRMWDDKAPDFAATQQSLQKTFAETGKLELKNLAIGKVSIDGDKASVRVSFEISAMQAQTGKPATGFGKWNRRLYFSRAGKEWQVWREVSSEEELVSMIGASQSEAERQTLLERNQELQTAALVSALTKYGRQRFDQGQMAEAFSLYNLAVTVAEKISYPTGKANALRLIGLFHSRQGRKEQALQYYKESLSLAKEAGSREMEVRALNSLGVFHQQRTEHQQALDYLQQAKAIAEEVKDDDLLLMVLNNASISHQAQSRYTEAIDELTQALEIVKKLDIKAQIIIVTHNIGTVYISLGNYAKAFEYFQNNLTLAEKINDQKAIASARTLLGQIYTQQGNHAKALEENQKGMVIAQQLNDKPLLAQLTAGAGIIQLGLAEPAQALISYKRALQLYEELGQKTDMAILQSNIGSTYIWLGDFAQALEYLKNSLALSEETGDQQGIVITLLEIGKIHQRQENLLQGLNYFERGLEVAEKYNLKNQITQALANIASYSIAQEQYVEAVKYLERSIKIAREADDKLGMALALESMGDVNHDQRKLTDALGYYREGLKIAEEVNNKERIFRFLLAIAAVYTEQGKFAESLALTDRAASMAKSSNDLNTLWQIAVLAGDNHSKLHQPEQAKQSFMEAIAAIEKAREGLVGNEQEIQNYFKNKSESYHGMIELLVSENNLSKALAYAEQFKGRVLLETLQSGKVNVSKTMSAQEQEKERRFQSELISLNSQISRENRKEKSDEAMLKDLNVRLQKARQEYEDFQFTLYAAHPELKIQRGQMQPITLKDAHTLLPDGKTALLEFVVKDDKSFLFVITKKNSLQKTVAKPADSSADAVDLQVYSLNIKQKDLQTLTQSFVASISKRSAGYKAAAAKLYDLLLKPAAAQLKNINNLVIVPDDVLWELPFQALQSTTNRFVVQDYAISYAPSLTVLREMNKKKKSSTPKASETTLLALGNPDIGKETRSRVEAVYMDEKLEPLPEAERQVKALANLYGAMQSKIYIGAEAREERVKQEASRYKILHLATHGMLNNASPMYSHLVLSQSLGDVNEDGLLEAWEIMRMELDAELAVLSACDTARGKVSAGEGVIGLSWSLFVAGCPSVVVSQWKVESSSTTELMLEFHRRLRGSVTVGKASPVQSKVSSSKSEALRQASLKLLRSQEYRHPFYWAAFIVVGDNSWK